MTAELPRPLRGIVPPLVTPLVDRDALDVAGLERLIEHILAGGVHGLFILGTTGEAPSLSYRLRNEVIRRACRQVAGRVPVLVGITDTSFIETIHLAQAAAAAGAQGVVLAPPYYFTAGQSELLAYLEALAPEMPLPLYLYNMPSHTKLVFQPALVRQAADLPNVVGLKDSSANMIYFHELLHLFEGRRDFSLLVGPEELLAETLMLGGHGGINGGANFFPRLYVDLYEAARAKDLDRVGVLHRQVIRISTTIYSVTRDSSSYLRGLKCALSCLGLCDDFLAEPFRRFGEEEREKIRGYLADLKLL
ncbi:MAG: dihydrodipicolinate synthase family protein [Planctomycetia bacterium]|nr:dihydrodipicolinate synthase family protein [Planctomycetia bacterium]